MNLKLHKELNREPVKFEKELNIKMYKEIVLKINQSHSLEEEFKFTNQEIREKLGIRKKEELLEFQDFFHDEGSKKKIFLGDKSITGGLFLSMVDDKGISFMINPYVKKYFYSKLDIDQWYQVEGKKEKIKALELKEEQQEKLLNMMTTVINHSIKGKYSQRLLDLLMQFKGSGVFTMKWTEFREVLEIPENYKPGNIDQRILNPAKVELQKAGIKITKIEKKKKGRSIDSIRILFKLENNPQSKQSKGTKPSKEKSEELREPMRAPINKELEEYKAEIIELSKKQVKDDFTRGLMTVKLRAASTKDQVNEVVREYNINFELF